MPHRFISTSGHGYEVDASGRIFNEWRAHTMHNVTSPRADDEGLEARLQRESTAPRVTLQDVHDAIKSEHYYTAWDGVCASTAWDGTQHAAQALSLITFCTLVLHNGYTVTGMSAVVSPENFQADIGRTVAKQKALDQVWPLLGFRLCDRRTAAVACSGNGNPNEGCFHSLPLGNPYGHTPEEAEEIANTPAFPHIGDRSLD